MLIRSAFTVDLTEAEGPGRRFALWVQGCSLACPGCCNPQMWSPGIGDETTVALLLQRVQRIAHSIEGISLLGGEPCEQDAPLAHFARQVRGLGLTVMTYSGYSLSELQDRGSALLKESDLLVAGRYRAELHTTKRRWIGSSNQTLHFLSDAYSPDDPRFAEPNHAELILDSRGELTLVGFPFPSVQAAFRSDEATKAKEPAPPPGVAR